MRVFLVLAMIVSLAVGFMPHLAPQTAPVRSRSTIVMDGKLTCNFML